MSSYLSIDGWKGQRRPTRGGGSRSPSEKKWRLQTLQTLGTPTQVKNDTVAFRVPNEYRAALKREQKRMSRAMGEEVKMSVVIRALLAQALRKNNPKLFRKAAA